MPIANPLSENFAVLRPSVLPGLVDAVAHNRRREQRDVRLFEIGARFSRARGERRVARVRLDRRRRRATTGAAATRDVDFFDIKGVVERVCQALRVDARTRAASPKPWLVPGRAAAIVADGARIGVARPARTADRRAARPAGDDAVYVAEIDLDALDACRRTTTLQVEPLPRYPSVTRDISMLVDDTLPAADRPRHDSRRRAGHARRASASSIATRARAYPTARSASRCASRSGHPTARSPTPRCRRRWTASLAALKDRHDAVQR